MLKYDVVADDFALSPLSKPGRGPYRHLVCAHVIEHFDDPAHAVRSLLRSGARLGLESMVFVVPGSKGFATDATHRKFVTEDYIRAQELAELRPSVWPRWNTSPATGGPWATGSPITNAF